MSFGQCLHNADLSSTGVSEGTVASPACQRDVVGQIHHHCFVVIHSSQALQPVGCCDRVACTSLKCCFSLHKVGTKHLLYTVNNATAVTVHEEMQKRHAMPCHAKQSHAMQSHARQCMQCSITAVVHATADAKQHLVRRVTLICAFVS